MQYVTNLRLCTETAEATSISCLTFGKICRSYLMQLWNGKPVGINFQCAGEINVQSVRIDGDRLKSNIRSNIDRYAMIHAFNKKVPSSACNQWRRGMIVSNFIKDQRECHTIKYTHGVRITTETHSLILDRDANELPWIQANILLHISVLGCVHQTVL